MKTASRCVAAGMMITVLFTATGSGDGRESKKDSESPPSRKALEESFRRMLTGSVLVGSWQMTGPDGLEGRAPLTEARSERYTIDKVSRASDDYWIITARVQYADKDVRIPITVRVVWAEDAPIITLDRMALPGLGTYSARVMIYRNFYAGTWFGANYGGILSGQIVRQGQEPKQQTQQPAPKSESNE
jgi:hypothetical protein